MKKVLVVFTVLIVTMMAGSHLHTSYAAVLDSLEENAHQLLRENSQLEDKYNELVAQNEELSSIVGRLEDWHANVPDEKTVYLTFDDGPSSNTIKVLDILNKYGIKATFFVNGNKSEFAKTVYQRIVNEGHALGNHTYSHNYQKIYSSRENFMADVKKLEDYLYDVTGVRPDLLRFPGGSSNRVSYPYGGEDLMHKLTKVVLAEGYEYVDWNVDSSDARRVVQKKEVIVQSVLEGVKHKKAAVVLMHDSYIKTTTVEALPEIIETLQSWGYKFDKLTPESFIVHHLK